MAISEKIELLGKGLYTDIPDVLTLSSIPTASELDYVGSEDFDKTMLDSILPKAVAEDIDFRKLLEIDYYWICRCLRILNYGPYFTTNTIYCTNCGEVSQGEFQVNLNTIACKPLPENFVNDIIIYKDEFIDFDDDIHIKLPTIQQVLNSTKDKLFGAENGPRNSELARICYMISSIRDNTNLTPMDIKLIVQRELSAADYAVLKTRVSELTDYGLRAGGSTQCPKCHKEGAFIALVNDLFFRPTLGDLRQWKLDRSRRGMEDVSSDTTTTI